MKLTLEQAKEMMDANCGSLYLHGTPITTLPEGLTVGGSLYLHDPPDLEEAHPRSLSRPEPITDYRACETAQRYRRYII